MPSGRTHDSITLWSLPLLAGGTFAQTQNGTLTLLVSGGYLFSGLMFGPDLDIHSRQYRRWGVLRWIWLPYRRSMRHRSVLSHGPIVGTVLRIIYLGLWLLLLGLAVTGIAGIVLYGTGKLEIWQPMVATTAQTGLAHATWSLQNQWPAWLALLFGLELGALVHALSDGVGSMYKQLRPRRKPTKRKVPPPAPVAPPPTPPRQEPELPTFKPPMGD
ncbi:MAG TPA: metal-binding protein [Coleofasciculaceae cyanobacterium]